MSDNNDGIPSGFILVLTIIALVCWVVGKLENRITAIEKRLEIQNDN